MSLAAKLIVSAIVLAVTIPLAVMVLRRMIRGERFAKNKLGDLPLTPPSAHRSAAGAEARRSLIRRVPAAPPAASPIGDATRSTRNRDEGTLVRIRVRPSDMRSVER